MALVLAIRRTMTTHTKNLIELANAPTRRHAVAAFTTTFGGLAAGSNRAFAGAEDEISHTAESIHQEPIINASRKRVYDALTETSQFEKVIEISGVMKSMASQDKPAFLGGEPGSAFTLFGGYITGRQLELVPGRRIVQAWRVGSWEPGVYSIAKFELLEQGSGTKIVFDHTGFPKGLAEHLASGWKEHYWEPLQKFLS